MGGNINMNQYAKLIIESTLVGTFCALLFLGGIFYERWDGNLGPLVKGENSENVTLQEFSILALDELKDFYHYNSSNIGKDLNMDELKAQGGVCEHYSNWYVDKFKEKGFNAKQITFYGTEKGHAITIAWNDNLTEYCVLDQLERRCTSLE